MNAIRFLAYFSNKKKEKHLKMKKNILLLLFAVVSFSYSAFAQQKETVVANNEPGWHKITQTVADLKQDHDDVLIEGEDHFKALRLHIEDAPVEMEQLSVVYGDGQHEDIPVRYLINPGGDTRQIDLEGKDRIIKKIVLKYKTVSNPEHDKARIEIWGLK